MKPSPAPRLARWSGGSPAPSPPISRRVSSRRSRLRDRVADLRPEAQRDRRRPRQDARPPSRTRCALPPTTTSTRRSSASTRHARPRLLQARLCCSRSKPARRRSSSSTRSGSAGGARSSSATTVDGRPDVPVHFHGHNDFGLATAAAVAAVRAGATWIRHDRRVGSARGTRTSASWRSRCVPSTGSSRICDSTVYVTCRRACRTLGLCARASGSRSRGRRCSAGSAGARCRASSHDPPSIEPYSSRLVATERGIVLGKKSGLDSIRIKARELRREDVAERRADVLARVKELGARKRDSSRDDLFRKRGWLTTTR